MKAYYNDIFVLPLPDGHRFPMSKYRLLRERIIATGILGEDDLIIPEPATDEQILLAHDEDYLERVKQGTLSRKEILRIGFPWSVEMVERSRRSSGATICAARSALTDGIAANLAGGTHHAGRGFGAGYSVFNDSVIAAREIQAAQLVEKVAVIDCDVHQGNGTADIAADDPSIFTFSIHGEKNFPFRKVAGDMDIGLPNETNDTAYLGVLEIAVERILFSFQPDLVIYQSGADPYIGDALGKLSLTKAGLAKRDDLVIGMCRDEGIPVAVTMGGGYAPSVDDIVDIHHETIRIASQYTNEILSV
jgi:acetoin utilization deacetylase AcuC-like enzyme